MLFEQFKVAATGECILFLAVWIQHPLAVWLIMTVSLTVWLIMTVSLTVWLIVFLFHCL